MHRMGKPLMSGRPYCKFCTLYTKKQLPWYTEISDETEEEADDLDEIGEFSDNEEALMTYRAVAYVGALDGTFIPVMVQYAPRADSPVFKGNRRPTSTTW